LPPNWNATDANLDKELWLVKTHDVPPAEDKAIYIMRDGREASVSYVNWLRRYLRQDVDLFDVIAGAVHFGSWSDHIAAWSPLERKGTLLLKFEDLVTTPDSYISILADFLERTPIAQSLPTFAQMHAINPAFFPSGKKDSWKKSFSEDLHIFYWLIHRDTMIRYGYDDDMPRVFESGASPSEQRLIALASWGVKAQRTTLIKWQQEELGRRVDLVQSQLTREREAAVEREAAIASLHESVRSLSEERASHLAAITSLHESVRSLHESVRSLSDEVRARENEVRLIYNSRTFRLGRAMTWPVRALRRFWGAITSAGP
jgi:hypothetical protein